MKNQGISLITLIITIIVIIILAAIVIFTGLRTPDSAQFSSFTNDVDTVYTAIIDRFADVKVEHAVKGDYRTNEQIYIELAIGEDPGQYATMATDHVNLGQATIHNSTSGENANTLCQHILGYKKTSPAGAITHATQVHTDTGASEADIAAHTTIKGKVDTALGANKNKIGAGGSSYTLPLVRQYDDGWYVTNDGRVFNSTGYIYNDNTYFNATYYTEKEQLDSNHDEDRATTISKFMNNIDSKSGFKVTFE